MIATNLVRRVVPTWRRHGRSAVNNYRTMSSGSVDFSSAENTNAFADHCDLNLAYSPYPPVPEGPYEPLAEFVMQDWKGHNPNGGFLGEQIAIRDTATSTTRSFDDYYNIATQVGAVLLDDYAIEEDQCVALYCPNHCDYLPISLAVALCGSKLTPINPLYTRSELSTVLQKSRSKVLFVHVSKLDVALESVQQDCPGIENIVVITDEAGEGIPEGTVNLKDLLDNPDKRLTKTRRVMHKHTKTHPYLLPYSSGTTGQPKGVCLTHENMVVNLLQFHEIEGLAFAPDHKLISPLPFFHIYAFELSMIHTAWKGHELITSSGRFDLEEFCQTVQEHKPERSHLVPPIMLGLGKHPIVDKYDMSSLKTIISAAAPLGEDNENAVKKRFDGICVKQGWGMSELSPLGTLNSDFNAKPGSVGPLCPNTFGKVVGEDGKSLPPNESGELLIKGPQVMMGYLDDHDKTAECLSHSGWLRTGDIAHFT
ncbi:7a-methyl-1,5-dioxo-octahydro-1H-inden-4-yl (Partial), partial [Seminavis robusta]